MNALSGLDQKGINSVAEEKLSEKAQRTEAFVG